MTRFAPEGYPFIAVFAALSAGVYAALGPLAAALPLALALFMLYFFRDPERSPAGEGFLSPADGRVIKIEEVYEGDYLKAKARLISIFMSPLDVHVNRAPCGGEVREVRHTPGSFKSAYTDEAHAGNENTAMFLDCGGRGVLVRQVAGSLARRVVCRARPGDRLARGERFGIIKFSSRVDLYLPEDARVLVKFGDRVRAGETVLAAEGRG
ncbi:MAG: phosphatidylserine decarboxylase family protein [Thermodesulfovibrionales bacterium]